MTFKKAVCAIAMAAAFLSCSTKGRKPDASDVSLTYSHANIRQLATSDYEAAMGLAEEGMRKGQLSAFESYELRSSILYQYSENFKGAAEWLRKALEQDEAQNPSTRTELLYHYVTILKEDRDFTACLATCAEGKELAHGSGAYFQEYSFDFLAGSCLFAIGEDDSGVGMMKDAIKGAKAVAVAESDYGHLIYFTSNLVNCLIDAKDYDAALEECETNEILLSNTERYFADVSKASSDYYDRCWFYLELNRAICLLGQGRKAEAEGSFKQALDRDYAKTEGGKFRLVDYYSAMGEPDNIVKIYEEIPYSESDTVNRKYRLRVARLRDAYMKAGLEDDAARMDERYKRLSNLLEQKENGEGIRINAAQFDTQHYRLALGDTLYALKKYRQAIMMLIGLVMVAFGAFVLINHKVSVRKEKQHLKEAESLEKSLRSLQKQVLLIAERELFNADAGCKGQEGISLPELIEGRQLYLNKNINRESAAALLGVSQAEITRELSGIEPGLTFPEYIKGLRIRHAMQLLGENPDISVSDLADRCGFYTTRTLQRSFLAITGKTPSEYARDLKRPSV